MTVSLEQLQELTDALHKAYCFENHTDGCGYHYGNWTDRAHYPCRMSWFKKTVKLVKKHGYEKVNELASDYAYMACLADAAKLKLRELVGDYI